MAFKSHRSTAVSIVSMLLAGTVACSSAKNGGANGVSPNNGATGGGAGAVDPATGQPAASADGTPAGAPAPGGAVFGASAAAAAASPNAPAPVGLSDADLAALIQKDGGAGRYLYVSFAHLIKPGTTALDLDVYRYGVTKTLNSVSVRPQIGGITPINADKTVYKVNLADFSLNAANWATISGAPGAAKGVKSLGGATVAQGDWLVYAVLRPEVYDSIMSIPNFVNGGNGLPELETELNADRSKAVYIVAKNSEVTFDTRILERIPVSLPNMPDGYYWRTYDFFALADPVSKAKGLADPSFLQSAAASTGQLVAGEMFFSLPNGMQGFMLSGFQRQHRIDAQSLVATDHFRAQDGLTKCVGGATKCGYVINGESCAVCHSLGIRTPKDFSDVRNATADQAQALIAKDQGKFAAALKAMGFDGVATDPIRATLDRYKAENQVSDTRPQGSEVNPVLNLGNIFGR